MEAAMIQLRTTAATVATRVSEELAATTSSGAERIAVLAAQQDLRRNLGRFQSAFHDALQEKVRHELEPRLDSKARPAATNWQSLSLVDDSEVEERMNHERIGQLISHECEWQLRDLAAYMGTITGTGRADEDRNPLRGDVLGAALYRGIEAVSDNADSRRILARDLGKAIAQAMPECYAEIVAGLQRRGIQPVTLKVRTVEGPGTQIGGFNSGYANLPPLARSSRTDLGSVSDSELMYEHRRALAAAAGEPAPPAPGSSTRGYDTPTRTGGMPRTTGSGASRHAQGEGVADGRRTPSPADAQLMALLRRLTAVASRSGEFSPTPSEPGVPGASGYGGPDGTAQGAARGAPTSDFVRSGLAPARWNAPGGAPYGSDGLTNLMAVNLIRAHREELMQASTGKLDHMVIDVVGSLFDQILSDTRVPPQMARQIARLQLPVLRVALNDATFFSTRRHPVRRFINRMASLACAFEDFDDGPGRQFLTRVAQLVHEIVEGDFDQIDLYAAKLAELERFITEQGEGGVEQSGAVTTLASKESELLVQQRYMQQLQAALAPLELPAYLGEFVSQVWSQALVLATRQEGTDADRAKRYRRVGCDLIMSVQPKGSPMLRKKFLMQLPPLMKDLNEGMQLIGWPEAAQREFFGKLLPAHAESLKGQPMSELAHNLMAKQLEGIFAAPIPGIESTALSEPLSAAEEAQIERRFTPEEARRVGLVQEHAVDWNAPVDIDLGPTPAAEPTGPAPLASDAETPLAPTSTESGELTEPTTGAQLMDHINLGFAYQMLLKDEWQKVRLAHVSSGRSFFVFTRGVRHQETISMTSRMLARMCETGRMRAVESAYLMERASHRVRKQLADLKAPTSRH
jgi:hypothetical protein